MKKKMLVALFAMMSVASASAYYIELKNKTAHQASGTFLPTGHGRFRLASNQTKRTNFSLAKKVTKITARAGNLRPGVFMIPKPKMGRNITIDIEAGNGVVVLSEGN